MPRQSLGVGFPLWHRAGRPSKCMTQHPPLIRPTLMCLMFLILHFDVPRWYHVVFYLILVFIYFFFFSAGEWDIDASHPAHPTLHPIVTRLSGIVWSSLIRFAKAFQAALHNDKKSQACAEKCSVRDICFSSKSRGTRFPALIVDRTIMQIRRRESGTSSATRWHSCVTNISTRRLSRECAQGRRNTHGLK